MAVLFGGRSSEHQVSCVSAGSVLSHLDPERFEAIAVGITEDGTWVRGPVDPAVLAPQGRTLPSVDPDAEPVALSLDPAHAGRVLSLSAADAGSVLADVDVVFPVLHGPFGEDGTVQGLLELAQVPYVGAGVLASAAGMDKEFTKKLLAAEGLPVGRQVVLRPHEETLSEQQLAALGLPLFVKPARGGSSIGISRVTRAEDLPAAIAHARAHDPKVIIEAEIVGVEIECGVLESPDGEVRASVLAEITMPEDTEDDGAFYDFDTKYLDDVVEFEVPARIDEATTAAVREIAVRAFRALDCQGLARVDFFVTADGPVINEINTMPGFTPISMYPTMWARTGVDYQELLTTLIDTALARGVGLR